jgi:hypothetical protein
MRIALEDLELDELHVIYPGARDYLLTDQIKVSGLMNYLKQSL